MMDDRSRIKEDGVTDLGYKEEEEKEEEENPYEVKDEAISELPREEKGGKKCIDPCPRFECILDAESCETNCQRTLDNPCLICKHDCDADTKEVLLREEYKDYKRFYGGKRVDAIYKEKAVDRRVELFNKKEELKDELEILKEESKSSILPSKLSWLTKKRRVNQIKSQIKEIEKRIDEGEELFKYE